MWVLNYSIEILVKLLLMALFQKTFLKNKYPVLQNIFLLIKLKFQNPVMLIFNNKLSVSPLTTHIPLKNVNKKLTKNNFK